MCRTLVVTCFTELVQFESMTNFQRKRCNLKTHQLRDEPPVRTRYLILAACSTGTSAEVTIQTRTRTAGLSNVWHVMSQQLTMIPLHEHSTFTHYHCTTARTFIYLSKQLLSCRYNRRGRMAAEAVGGTIMCTTNDTSGTEPHELQQAQTRLKP